MQQVNGVIEQFQGVVDLHVGDVLPTHFLGEFCTQLRNVGSRRHTGTGEGSTSSSVIKVMLHQVRETWLK